MVTLPTEKLAGYALELKDFVSIVKDEFSKLKINTTGYEATNEDFVFQGVKKVDIKKIKTEFEDLAILCELSKSIEDCFFRVSNYDLPEFLSKLFEKTVVECMINEDEEKVCLLIRE